MSEDSFVLTTYENYIEGKFVRGSDEGRAIPVFNPATEEEIGRVPESSEAEIDRAIEAASRAQKKWAKLAAVERGKYLREIAARVRDKTDFLARVITEEQGKPLGLAKVEVEFTADYLVYMAEWARRIEGEILTSDRPNEHIFLFRQPIGVIAGILPWNFPFFSGQVCNCAERVYVDRKIADEFTDRLAKAMKVSKFGNPLADLSVDYGPLINQEGLSKVEGMVSRAKGDGATVVTGGRRADLGKGWYYEPTVLADCRQEMEIVQKEIFGPVVPIVKVEGLEQAIEYANDSEYGLTSSIYTSNIDVAMRACKEIQFGETYINRENFEAMQGFHAGWRKSGIDGKHGLYEYTQTHVTYLQFNPDVK